MKMLQHLKSKEIVMISMNILQHICCDETLCQILMHHPQLLHLIFSNCKYDENNNDLRTQSLLCITNLIQVADGNTLKSKIVDQAKQFDLAIVFANNLGI